MTDSQPMRADEIYLAQFPFGDVPGMKLRPVLLLTASIGPVSEVLVAYISSVIPAQLLPSDMIMEPSKPEYLSTHLKIVSALRLHKLATIHASSLVRFLGALDGSILVQAKTKLKTLLAV
jgi:mRNA interferase MazF